MIYLTVDMSDIHQRSIIIPPTILLFSFSISSFPPSYVYVSLPHEIEGYIHSIPVCILRSSYNLKETNPTLIRLSNPSILSRLTSTKIPHSHVEFVALSPI
ncbi:hypothetical protein OCU04_007960 [Sclerotinia nivalis]|uniref:Uncharacterized protein n=1 Tax=Sclerotinia nivalis TaxID=352851 RepID=A0A9X0AJT4_9HELO|nr:hypothetical protein OCU04_007960 [Sclerotinia nivalis]